MAAALAPATRPVRPVDPDRPRRAADRGGMLDRLDRWFWRQEQKAREAYLAHSQDVFDLERRMTALERGTISRYY